MKQIFNLAILLLLISLYSCTEYSFPQVLAAVDSLTYTLPDSAITMLKHLETQMAREPEAVQMYCHLLRIKADDKAYRPLTSDSVILHVVQYYEKTKDKEHLMEAYFYAGRLLRELGDAPQALSYYQKAIEASKGSTDYKLISLIYSQIGALLSYQGLLDESLESFRGAYSYTVMAKDSTGMGFALRDMARAYQDKNNISYSLYYYRKAYALVHTLHHRFLMEVIQNQLASLYIQQKKYDLAKKALQPSLDRIDEHDKSAVYSIASKLYYNVGQVDSAIYYYKEILKCGNVYAKQVAYRGLAKIAMENQKPHEALANVDQYLLYTDSIQKITDTEAVRKTQAFYNYQLREKDNNRLKAANQKQRVKILVGTAISLLILISFILYRENSKRKALQLRIKLEELDEQQGKLRLTSMQMIGKNQQQAQKLQEQEERLKEMREEMKRTQEEKRLKAESDLLQSNICSFFRNSAPYLRVSTTDEQWLSLQKDIDDICDDFTGRLLALYSFNESELRICRLLKIRLLPTQIATLTSLSKSGVVSARKRMYKKVFKTDGTAEDWDTFIWNF